MKKKIWVLCAVLVMCACVFVGCNKKEDGEVTTTTTTETTMAETETDTETETTEGTGEDLESRLSSGVSKAVTEVSDMATTEKAS